MPVQAIYPLGPWRLKSFPQLTSQVPPISGNQAAWVGWQQIWQGNFLGVRTTQSRHWLLWMIMTCHECLQCIQYLYSVCFCTQELMWSILHNFQDQTGRPGPEKRNSSWRPHSSKECLLLKPSDHSNLPFVIPLFDVPICQGAFLWVQLDGSTRLAWIEKIGKVLQSDLCFLLTPKNWRNSAATSLAESPKGFNGAVVLTFCQALQRKVSFSRTFEIAHFVCLWKCKNFTRLDDKSAHRVFCSFMVKSVRFEVWGLGYQQ